MAIETTRPDKDFTAFAECPAIYRGYQVDRKKW
jgi:hypothetical protein